MGFTCTVCGKYHEEQPLDIRAELPDDVFELSAAERSARADIEDDFCRLDRRRFFVRGLIEIPIVESDRYFGFGIWIEVDEEDCRTLVGIWHEPVYGERFTGRLANELDTHPGSRNLVVSFETRELLPEVRVEEEHLLASEQRSGISAQRVDELSSSVLH